MGESLSALWGPRPEVKKKRGKMLKIVRQLCQGLAGNHKQTYAGTPNSIRQVVLNGWSVVQ